MFSNIESIDVKTTHSGTIKVYVQGTRSSNEVNILTVHDLGCNHTQYLDFLAHPAMSALVSRCVWYHIDVPGQDDAEKDLTTSFPTMQELAEDMRFVLDQLKIQHVVLLGEGAGANILARVAMLYDDRVLGAVLIHCTGSTAGFMESMRDKMIGWRLNTLGMHPSAENYLVLHRFGSFNSAKSEQELKAVVESFKDSLRNSINPRNLNKFINSFMGRSNITDKIVNLKCPVMFMSGAFASHATTVRNMYEALHKTLKDDPSRRDKVELVEVDGCANVLTEKPDKVAECLQYFLQGLGLVSGVINRRMSNTLPPARSMNRRMSMEDYDRPKGADNYMMRGAMGSPPKVQPPTIPDRE